MTLSQMALSQVTIYPSDRQCGLCFRNCKRQRCVRRNLLHIAYFFKSLYHCSFKKIFYPSTGIGRWYELFAGCFFLLLGYWLVWGSLLSSQISGVCLLPPTWWYTWHLIDDGDPWYLIEEEILCFVYRRYNDLPVPIYLSVPFFR